MNSILWRSVRISALAVTLALCASLPLKADLVKATVKIVQGDVKLVLPDGETGPLTTTSLIPAGSRIICGDNGTVAVIWMDGAHGVICPKTTVEVNSLSLTEEDGKLLRRVSLNLNEGTMFCELVHADGTGRFTVKTPKGTVEDKGTIWKLVVHGLNNVQASVLEGNIDFFLPTGFDVVISPGGIFTPGADGSSNNPRPDTMSDNDITNFRTFWSTYFPFTQLPNTGNESDYASGNPTATTTGGGGGGGGANIPLAESPGNFVNPTPTPAPTAVPTPAPVIVISPTPIPTSAPITP